jgi:hypothetical protein
MAHPTAVNDAKTGSTSGTPNLEAGNAAGSGNGGNGGNGDAATLSRTSNQKDGGNYEVPHFIYSPVVGTFYESL